MREVFRLVGKIALDGTVELNEKLQAIDKRANQVSRSLNKMGKDLMKIGKAFTKSITLPVVGALGAVTKFGADFERTMAQSTAIMGDLSDEMRSKMELAAREVAKTTKFGATEAAQAFEFLALAGLDAEQSIAALPQVAAFAQAGNFDLARATDLATDAQSALGLASADATENLENMTRVTDVLTRVATLANANTEQFSEALTEKAGVALRNLNKDIEEGSAALAVYADQGVKGGQAGTTLNATLEGLSRQAIINRDEFRALGIEVFDANGNMRNLADITADMENALGGMSTEQQRATLMQLGFNRQALNGLQMLMGNSEALREYETELRNAAGTTQQVADKQLKNFWDQLGLIKDRIIDVALTLWEEIEPVMMDVVIPALEAGADKLRALSEWFGDLSPPMKETVLMLVALAVSFGPVLMVVGKLATGFSGLIPLFAKLVTGQLSLNAAMKANPIGVVVTAIYLLITAGILLWKNWDTISEFFVSAWGRIKITTLKAIDAMLAGLEKFIGWIPGIEDAIKKARDNIEELITAEQAAEIERNAKKAADAVEEQTQTIRDAVKAMREDYERAKKTAEAMGEEFDENAEQVRRLKATIDSLVAQGIDPQHLAMQQLIKEYKELTKEKVKNTKQTKEETEVLDAWSKKLLEQSLQSAETLEEQTAIRLRLLENEKNEAIKQAEKEGQDTALIERYYENEKSRIVEEANQKRAEVEKSWADRVKEQNKQAALEKATTLEEETKILLSQLDEQEKAEINKAKKTGADIAQIEAYYQNERNKIIEDANKKRAEVEKSWADRVKEQNKQAALEKATTLEEETKILLSQLDEQEKAEINKAKKTGADIAQIEAYYQNERNKIIEDANKKRSEFEQEWNQKYFEASADRMAILEAEMKEALKKAEKLGAKEADIVAYYEQKKRELRRETFNSYLSTASDILGRLDSIFGQHYTNRNAELDNWYQKQKEVIEASQMSEEEKEAALKQLDEERDARKREMARKQAAAEKASSLFSIAINTARAAIEALPNLVLSGIITAMGTAQAALVAAEPLPALKTGGLAVGEVTAIVGDTPKRELGELILPMRTGVEMLADMLIGKLSQVALPRPAFAMAGGVSNAYDNRTEVHLHVGTLVADELGLKKLERKLAEIRIMENRRRGG